MMANSVFTQSVHNLRLWDISSNHILSFSSKLLLHSKTGDKELNHVEVKSPQNPICTLKLKKKNHTRQNSYFTPNLFTISQAMAPHSSTLAWKIPWTEKPGRLKSMGSLRVQHDWETSLSLFTFMHWRRKWQPTPVFLPGESQGRRSLVGCRLWGRTKLDTTEVT